MFLIWRRDSNAKSAKKNTSPNVIRLQYLLAGKLWIVLCCQFYTSDSMYHVILAGIVRVSYSIN